MAKIPLIKPYAHLHNPKTKYFDMDQIFIF